MLITTGFSVGASLIDNVINRDEKLIEKGEEARDSINNTFKEFSNIKNTIDSLGSSFNESGEAITDTGQAIDNISDKYVELSRGVNKLNNENKSLSDSDYQTYLDLSNQLSTLFPELVTGYDAQGNAILNLGSNAQEAASSLRELYDMQLLSANASIGKELQEAFTGTSAQINKYEKQNDEYSNNVEDLTAQIDSLNTLKNAWNEDSFENPRIEIDSRDFANIEEFADYQNSLISSLQKAGIDYTPNLANGIEIDPETGETFQRFVVDLGEATEQQYNEVLAEIVDQVGEKTLEKNNNLSKINANKLLIADQWKALSTSLGQYLQTTDTFDNLNSNLQNAILTNLVDFNHDALTDTYDGDVLSFMYREFLEPLSGISKSAQEALSEVFTVDSSKLTVGEYENQIEDALEKAFPGDSTLQDQWSKKFGFDDIIAENGDQLEALTEQFQNNVDDLNKMSMDDIELAYDLVINDGEVFNTFAELQERIQEMNSTIESGTTLEGLTTKVTTAQGMISTLNTVLSETTTAGGLTSDNIKVLSESFGELEGIDTSSLFVNTADGVKLDVTALKDLTEAQNDIIKSDLSESIETQTANINEQYKDLDKLTKGTEEYTAALDDIKSAEEDLYNTRQLQSQFNSVAKQQEELLSDYNQWVTATSTANAGDKYNNMYSGLQNALDAYEKGLIGTDDFKSFAALISPTGSDDIVNFAENIGKATRYITEDKSGINNFLSDLGTKTNEAGQALASFDEASQRWTFNITDMYDAAQQMGIGEDMMTAIFGRARDYGINNNFISSVEEGTLRLQELYNDYIDEVKRYEDLTKDGGLYETTEGTTDANQSAIDESRKKQSELLQNIRETRQNMVALSAEEAINRKAERQAAKDTISMLNETAENIWKDTSLDKADKDGIIAGINEDIQSIADQYGIELTADLTVEPSEFEKEYQKRIEQLKDATIESPVERDFGGDTQAEQNYLATQQKIQEANKNGNEVLKQSIDTLKEYSELELGQITLGDGVYNVAGLESAEDALETLKQEFGLTSEQASQLVNVLADMGVLKIDPEFDTSNVNEELESIKEEASLSGLTEKIELEADVTTMGMDELQNRLDTLEEYRPQIEAEFGVDSSELDAYDQLIENTELQIKVQAILDDTGYTIEQLQGMTEGELVEVGFTPGDTSQIQAYLQSLNGETAEIPMTVKIDESQFSLLTNLTNETAEVNVVPKNPEIEVTVKDATVKVTPKPNPIDVDAKETTVPVKAEPNPIPVGVVPENGNSLLATLNLGGENQNVTASAAVSGTEDVVNLKAQIDTLYDRVVTEEAEVIGTNDVIALKAAIDSLYSKTVTATALTSGILSVQSLASAIDSLSSKTVTVTTNYVTTGSPGGGRASGTLSSPTVVPAHAAGTAYNVINYKNAYKDGKVALDKDEEALVNELGMIYAALLGDKH